MIRQRSPWFIKTTTIQNLSILLFCLIQFSCVHLNPYVPFCGPGNVLSEAEIREVAEENLNKFCLRERIDRSLYIEPPSITFNKDELIWVIDCEGEPYFIRFIVDSCGRVETSYGPRGKLLKVK